MATTKNGIKYPDNYSAIADIPEDLKKMAESIDTAIENNKYNDEDIIAKLDDIDDNIENLDKKHDKEVEKINNKITVIEKQFPTRTRRRRNNNNNRQ